MKKISLTLILILLLSLPVCAEDDLIDFDTSILDTPFSSNRKAVTQEQFNQALAQKQQRSKGLIQKFREFLSRNKIENDPNLKNFKTDAMGEMGQMPDVIKNKKPSLMLSVELIDSFGATIPKGHYQIVLKQDFGKNYISFIQGAKTYGSIEAQKFDDDWDTNQIIYSRIIFEHDRIAQIIYSDLDNCYKAMAKIAPLSTY